MMPATLSKAIYSYLKSTYLDVNHILNHHYRYKQNNAVLESGCWILDKLTHKNSHGLVGDS